MNYKIWGRKFKFRGRQRLHRFLYTPEEWICLSKAAGDCRMPIGKQILNVLWSRSVSGGMICLLPTVKVWRAHMTMCLHVAFNMGIFYLIRDNLLSNYSYLVIYRLSSKYCDRQTDLMDKNSGRFEFDSCLWPNQF